MKKFFLFSLSLMFITAYLDAVDWTITKSNSPLSYTAEFGIKKGDVSVGKVIRTGLFTPSYYYDLVDDDNVLQVRGITRVFSLGFFFTWGMDINLYENDSLIGMIQGKSFTNSRAKFVFYNADGQAVANAFLDDESSNFIIVSAQNEANVLAELDGKVYGDASIWKIKPVNDFQNLDVRALQIFAGFVADYQRRFIRPPQIEVY